MCLRPTISGLGSVLVRDRERALGDVLGEVADALEIAGDADGRHDLAQVDRHRLAPRDRRGSPAPRPRAASVSICSSLAMTFWASCGSRRSQRIDRVDRASVSAMPPISAILRSSSFELVVVGLTMCVVMLRSPALRRPSAEAAGDVVLRALVARRGEDPASSRRTRPARPDT